VVRLSPEDHNQLSGIRESLVRELSNAAREHARDERYGFLGPITFELEADDDLHTGQFRVTGRLAEGEGAGMVGTLVLPTGQRVVLGEFVLTIGRLPECTITLADTNVSRKHAEVRPEGAGFLLSDLGSTNGTFVNGARITQHELSDGDVITFGGAAKIKFEAS
jgi:pSer/pThr/pTyr-binding forkhead associated (FHA) protein